MENVMLTDDEKLMCKILIEIAKDPRKDLIFFSELNKRCRLGLNFDLPQDRNKLGEMLGNICTYVIQHKKGMPLLSAVAVSKDCIHGVGIGNIAKDLHNEGLFEVLDKDNKPYSPNLSNKDDREDFAEFERKRVKEEKKENWDEILKTL